jgi:squalene-associated FAD-dependent desaturase
MDNLAQDLMAASQPHVAVVGGGCAGLAAAAALAANGVAVTLFEAAPHLGGRARGVSWKGLQLDNGQHILLGAYSQTLRMLKLAGVDTGQAFERISLRLRTQGELDLRAPKALPAPLHILTALLLADGLSMADRMSALHFMAWMQAAGFSLPADEPLQALLQRRRQSGRLIRLLWEPLCLAALNTPLHEASAQVFLNVLRDSFARSRSDSDMLLPKRDLSALFVDPLTGCIRRNGGDVRLGCVISRLVKNHAFELDTDDGERLQFSHVIAAVPPFRLATLLDGIEQAREITNLVSRFEYQPIYTVYLQYPESVRLEEPMLGLAKGHGQWVFDRGRLYDQPGLLAVVISAEGAHQQLSQQALAQTVAAELAEAFPDLSAPLWHKVIAEKRATFACKPGLARPHYRTQVPGLYLAGDYTSDGITANLYPATIEGAVRSGVQCAHEILAGLVK